MPTQTAWIDPELFLEHRGVRVFHTYKDDDYDQGVKRYWFTLNSLCGELDQLCLEQPCRHVFDVRELPTWQAPESPPYCIHENDTPENHAAWEQYWEKECAAIRSAIAAAIERGELRPRGRSEHAERQQQSLPGPAQPGSSSVLTGASIPQESPAQR
jgi:hypothetical protein